MDPDPGHVLRVAVLVSGSGSNLQALLDDQHGYEVVLVVSDRPAARALERARAAGVPAVSVALDRPRDPDARRAWEQRVAQALSATAPDLVVMAGWMRIMSPAFVDDLAGRLINQHPALLPDTGAPCYTLADGRSVPAIRGAHAVRDALRAGLPVTGCTVHWVTPEVDVGPALARAEVPILPGDDEHALHERIKREEQRLIVEVVRRLSGS